MFWFPDLNMCMSLARFGHGHDSWQSQARDVYGHCSHCSPSLNRWRKQASQYTCCCSRQRIVMCITMAKRCSVQQVNHKCAGWERQWSAKVWFGQSFGQICFYLCHFPPLLVVNQKIIVESRKAATLTNHLCRNTEITERICFCRKRFFLKQRVFLQNSMISHFEAERACFCRETQRAFLWRKCFCTIFNRKAKVKGHMVHYRWERERGDKKRANRTSNRYCGAFQISKDRGIHQGIAPSKGCA